MRTIAVIGFLLILGLPGAAQHKPYTIDASTPEGRLLQVAGQEEDAAKKTALLEDFVAKYPKHDGTAWAYAQLLPLYVKAGQLDKALAAGDRVMALDPDDLDTALAALKALEANKDPDTVKKWSAITSGIARKTIAAQRPTDADEADWKQRVDYAKQVDVYCEYALYASALASTNPAKVIELVEALEQRNPHSQYLAQSYESYFRALVQSQNTDKAIALAEKQIAAGQADEDMLLAVAQNDFNKQRNPQQVIAVSQKAIEMLGAKAAPAGVDAGAWENARKQKIGYAHWYAGMTYANENKFSEADKELRAALPEISGNDFFKGGALFALGLANYKIGDAAKSGAGSKYILEAYHFSQQSAAIKSPWQALAQKNVTAIRAQYHITK